MNYQFRLTRNLSNPILVKLGQLDDNRDDRAAGLCSDDDWPIFGFDERQILGLGLCSDDDLQIFGVSTRGFAVSFEVSSGVKLRSENNFVQNIKNLLKNPNDIWKISKRRFLSEDLNLTSSRKIYQSCHLVWIFEASSLVWIVCRIWLWEGWWSDFVEWAKDWCWKSGKEKKT